MNVKDMILLKWQPLVSEARCAEALSQQPWRNGFQCTDCGHDHEHWVASFQVYHCNHCRHQNSVTADALFHCANLPLEQWFLAIYLMVCDKGGLSALHLFAQIGVSWIIAHQMLRKMRDAMADRDIVNRMGRLVVLDDAFVGGRRAGGKSVRSAEGKTPILDAIESRGKKAGFMDMETISSVSAGNIRQYVLGETQHLEGRVTHPELVEVWLPWMHIAIGNLKTFLLGTYLGVTGKYLDGIVYPFN